MHDTGFLGLVHWDDPEGWNGEGSPSSLALTFKHPDNTLPLAL